MQVSELGRYRPSETVVIEVQYLEVGEVSELGRYRPPKTVVAELQIPEVGEVSEFGRQSAVQRPSNDTDQQNALWGSP